MNPRTWQTVLDEASARCAAAGRPLTIQRQAVLKALWKSHDHPTADQVYARVSQQHAGLSRATVFRSLETLAELGIARRVSHHGVGLRFDARLDGHHHLLCRVCGSLADFDDAALGAIAPSVPDGFAVDEVAVTCLGVCARCRRSA